VSTPGRFPYLRMHLRDVILDEVKTGGQVPVYIEGVAYPGTVTEADGRNIRIEVQGWAEIAGKARRDLFAGVTEPGLTEQFFVNKDGTACTSVHYVEV